ncbi:potassium transporter Trk [Halobacteriales archaeon SW_7_68_16]|nr:MAG: potassium transporter Trk [Halobacteriales archaeon SW_7_68_16]
MSVGDLRVVIVGASRVGFHAARGLNGHGHDVTVIERDEDRCDEVSDAYVATVIRGDGTRPDILRQADLERADAIAALTPNAGSNLAVCVLATRMEPSLRTVMRVSTPEGAESYEEIVDETIFPERAGARAAVNAITGNAFQSAEVLPGDLEVLGIRVMTDSPVAGKTLADVALPAGSLVISNADGGAIPTPETKLKPGRTYLVAVEPAVSEEVRQLFQG